MPDNPKRVARLLDEMRTRLGRLEQATIRDDSIPNELETVTDRGNGTETTSQSTGNAGTFTFDQDTFDGSAGWR